jgi:hypothetical protein
MRLHRTPTIGTVLGSGLFTVGAVLLTAASIGAVLIPASVAVAARGVARAARTARTAAFPLQRLG